MGFRLMLGSDHEWMVLGWNKKDWSDWEVVYRAITLGNGKEAQTGWLTAFKLLENVR